MVIGHQASGASSGVPWTLLFAISLEPWSAAIRSQQRQVLPSLLTAPEDKCGEHDRLPTELDTGAEMVHTVVSGVARMMTLARHRGGWEMEILDPDTACPSNCPSDPEETAEAYVMRKLAPLEAESFRTHVAVCEHCRRRVAFHVDYIQALRDATVTLARDAVPPLKKRSAAS